MSGPLHTYLAKRVDHVLPLAHSSPRGGHVDAGGLLTMSVLTYNVWFDPDDWQPRFDAVAGIIEHLQPTVVCLQEVTQQFAQALKRHPWLRHNYHMLDADDETVLKTVAPYGVAMLSRYPFELLELHETHSLMQRNALLAEININGHKALGDCLPPTPSITPWQFNDHSSCKPDSHLARDFDGFSPPLRKAQLAKMFRLLDEHVEDDQVELRVITGDFNFPAGSQEEVGVSKDYVDTWNALRPDEPGHTTGINYPRPRSRPSRYDRILYRSSSSSLSSAWCVQEVRTVGAESIGTRGASRDIFPSDHLGVFAVLSSTPT